MMAAKKKETAALTASVEAKTKKTGELAVEITMKKNDLEDTQEALLEDKKFQEDLAKSCSTKTAEWEERSKTRADELTALAETIKAQRAHADAMLQELQRAHPRDRARLDFIMLA